MNKPRNPDVSPAIIIDPPGGIVMSDFQPLESAAPLRLPADPQPEVLATGAGAMIAATVIAEAASEMAGVGLRVPLGVPAKGYAGRTQEFRLSPTQAATLARVAAGLSRSGVALRRQSDVFGWLLDQIALASCYASPAEAQPCP